MDHKISTPAKINTFFSQQKIQTYKKGDMIFLPGDPVTDVYFVHAGFIRMYCELGDGKELTLNIFKPGSYFPMFLVLESAPNAYYFQAMTATKLSKVPKDDVVRFLKNEPDVLFEFTRRLTIGLNGLLTNIQYTLFGPVHTRIVSAILFLAKRFGEKLPDGGVRISLPLTHQDIANVVGIARETASIEIEKLVGKDLILDTKKQITIRNVALLEKEALIDDETQVSDYSL
jgi:CRP-like cAMP-binding protein